MPTIRNAVWDFVETAQTDVSYNDGLKYMFHAQAQQVLMKLAAQLGYTRGQYDLKSNRGGPAVSGEVTLRADKFYICFGQFYGACAGMFMWRTCKGLKDKTGGHNRWVHYSKLKNLVSLAEDIKSIIE